MRERSKIPLGFKTSMASIMGFSLAVALASAGAASQRGIYGNWNRDDGLGGVRIAPCGTALCGHVTWLKNPAGPGHVGERVFFDMLQVDDRTWTGQAHNPEDGKDYAGRLILAGNRLTTSGCVLGGLICKSLGLSRGH